MDILYCKGLFYKELMDLTQAVKNILFMGRSAQNAVLTASSDCAYSHTHACPVGTSILLLCILSQPCKLVETYHGLHAAKAVYMFITVIFAIALYINPHVISLR
jgi:hypothetical protein